MFFPLLYAFPPLMCFGLIFLVFWQPQTGWRKAFLSAALVWGGLVVVVTDALSLLRELAFWPVLIAWMLLTGIAGGVLKYARLPQENFSWSRRSFGRNGTGCSRFETGLLAGIGVIVVLVGVTALAAPPNTYDSMTYHMSRVMHWMQAHSVAYYPTHILRQLHHNPWAEYAILQFQILTGTDRYANLVQWFSLVGSVVGVSLLAQILGASPRGQLLAGLVCATIPMAILQGSSTQTDLVASFWLVCFVDWALLLLDPGAGWGTASCAGLALGLAMLTKATAYVFAFPFLVWMGLKLVRQPRQGILRLGLVLAIAAALNGGHYSRNFLLFGTPLGPGDEVTSGYANESLAPAAIASNLIRNVAIHLSTPVPVINRTVEQSIETIHHYLGLSTNDPRLTFTGARFQIGLLSNHEDYATNPVHVFLIALAVTWLVWNRDRSGAAGYYLLAWGSAFVLFCIYLKWQPWISRLQLPLFILAAPVVGLAFSQSRHGGLVNMLMLFVLVSAFPWVLRNDTRPLLGADSLFRSGREAAYFNNQPVLRAPYTEAVHELLQMNCLRVGLILNADAWEYPLWALPAADNRAIVYEHVNVDNVSHTLAPQGDRLPVLPCIFFNNNTEPAPLNLVAAGHAYQRDWADGPAAVYTLVK